MQLDRARHRLAVCQASVLTLAVRQPAEVGCRCRQVREPSDLVLRIEAQMRARHLSRESRHSSVSARRNGIAERGDREARRLTTQSEESLKSARLIWLKKEVSRKNSSNAAEFSVWPSVGSAGRGPTSAWWHQSVEISSSFC